MTAPLVFDVTLAGLILAVIGWTLTVRDHRAAVIGFIVDGLLLTIAWVRLSAVDVALTEAAIGGGLTGMLLLGAAARPAPADNDAERPSMLLRAAAGALCALIAAGLAFTVVAPRESIPTLAPLVMDNLAQTGLGNPVAGVLFSFRALDTLMEKIVLLLALVGVWSFASDSAWGGAPALGAGTRPSSTLQFLGQLLPPFGITFAIYMCWIGATYAGGAFQGGTVLAAMWLLLMIAGLKEVPALGRLVRAATMAGPAVFLAIGIAGIVVAGAFLAYPAGYAKAFIVAIEFALTLSIGAALGLLAAGPPARVSGP